MDFNRYCRTCGHHIEFTDGAGYCPVCDKEITRKDTIPGWTRHARVEQLRAMHSLMCNANDEMIYDAWIYTMPDCPNEEDLIDIAMDENLYHEVFDKFIKLIQKDGNRW